MTFRFAVIVGLLLTAADARLRADPPLANYVYPAGGQRGSTVTLRVGGCDLNRECSWEFDGAGIAAPPQLHRAPETIWFEGPLLSNSDSQSKEDYPKDFDGRVIIADDAPLGIHHWRAWTSQGVTSTMKFVVGELPEVVEEEIDGAPIPVPVAMPATINGRIFPREDVNIWTFAAEAGESITCEVNSARLGYPLIARLEVLDPAGRRIAAGARNLGGDARVRFRATESGLHQVRILDIGYAGSQSHVYRLTMTNQPFVDAVYPLGGRAGSTVPFELTGQGVPPTPVSIALPDVDASHSPGPENVWTSFAIADELTNPVLLDVDDLPEYVEPDSAGTPSELRVELPAVLNGRIRSPGQIDEWTFVGKEGDTWRLDVRAARLESPLDSVLTVLDADGRELLRADDIGPGETDSQADFTVPADGIYRICIADQFASRGGERFAYRLRVTPPPAPDFELRLAGDAFTLNRGAEAALKVSARRIGGFDGEIALHVDELPPGVGATSAVIGKDASEVDWKFHADDSAGIQLSHLRVRGEAVIDGQTVVRRAFPTQRGEPPVDAVPLLVALPTPFKYAGRTSIEYVPCGSSLQWHFRLDRGGYEGPIDVELADRQFRHLMGLAAPRITVPAGVTEFDYPVFVAPWTLQGRTGRAVISASATLQEPDGAEHVVSFSTHADDDQVVVLASPPLMTIDSPRKTVLARPGATVSLPLKISRSARIHDATINVELAPARHVRGVAAHSCVVPPEATDCELELQFDNGEPGPWNAPLIVRATTETFGQPIIAEFALSVTAAADAESRPVARP